MTTTARPVAQSGTFSLGGDLPVTRLGYGAMRITGKGIWGPPADRDEAWAETSQEGLGVRDETWLTATTDESNRRTDAPPEEAEDDAPPPEDPEAGTGRPSDDE